MEKVRLRTVQTLCSAEAVDLFASPDLTENASQLDAGWPVQFVENTCLEQAILVESLLDGYRAWLPIAIAESLNSWPGTLPFAMGRSDIESRIDRVLQHAMSRVPTENSYRWGGNLGPNFDCSGLAQWSFRQEEIWLPRDAFHQHAWCDPVTEPLPGDLVFFGQSFVSHVGIWLGDGHYVHSSGAQHGHNGVQVDALDGDTVVAQHYRQIWRSFGRITRSRGIQPPHLGSRLRGHAAPHGPRSVADTSRLEPRHD